jgi:hypothetical protein
MKTSSTLTFCLSTVLTVSAFQSTLTSNSRTLSGGLVDTQRSGGRIRYSQVKRLASKSKGNNKSRSGPDMEDAFRQLEQLSFVGDRVADSPLLDEIEQEQKTKRDAAFAKAMRELNLKDVIDTTPVSAESEADIYKDMATELSSASSENDLKGDLELDFALSPIPTGFKNEAFMNQAIDEALDEAKEHSDDVVKKESLLDNKEIMAEIEKIFDRANDQLLQGLEEIRFEQVGNRWV